MSLINRVQKTDAVSYPVRFRYETLRSLLKSNVHALKILGDLGADLNHARYFDPRIKRPVQRLIHGSFLMAQELNLLTGNRHEDLFEVIGQIRNETERIFDTLPVISGDALSVFLDTEEALDHSQVGNKASMLARINRHLPQTVPPGFVITARAYQLFLDTNDLSDRIRLLIHQLDMRKDQETFKARTRTIREWIMQARIPEEILTALQSSSLAFPGENRHWAVRASAVDEDFSHSFASQYESVTQVAMADLGEAYRRVIASRFSNQAVYYRIHSGFREVRTPMAVLFMPMIDMAYQGTLHTRDINRPQENIMSLHVKDMDDPTRVDIYHVMGGTARRWIEKPGQQDASVDAGPPTLSEQSLCDIAALGQEARERIGDELHIEWSLNKNGELSILQAERLELVKPEVMKRTKHDSKILAMGGISIFPGRAEGNALYLKSPDHFTPAHKGSIVIVDDALPGFGPILTDIAALLVIGGHPTDALAKLAREYSVPAIFQLGPVARRLVGKRRISVNTLKRTVYEGSRWRGIRERVLARMAQSNRVKGPSPLYDCILRLNLNDPDSSSFKARSCASVQDTVLFMHEMSVRSMFGFGDQQAGIFSSGSSKLNTSLPLKCQVIDIDHSSSVPKKSLRPEDIQCLPFNALWKGISDDKLVWTQYWKHEMVGLHQDLKEAVLESNKGPRRISDMNYVIVSKDYVNFNARLFHHYIMVDSYVGPGTENNYIHFRFRASGGIEKNRSRCASFIETVLGRSGFGMDRKGDIVTAWMKCYARKESEKVLENLGRLMVCVRELDAILKNDADITRYADHFLKGSYDIFA